MNQAPERNPYSAPNHDAWQVPTLGGLASVLLGASIGMGANALTSYPQHWIWSWLLTLNGVPLNKLYYTIAQSLPYLSISHTTGALSTMAGGYWCARLSSENHLLRAFFSSLVIIAVTILQITLPYGIYVPDWSVLLSLAIPIPGYLLGAIWQRRRAGVVAQEARSG